MDAAWVGVFVRSAGAFASFASVSFSGISTAFGLLSNMKIFTFLLSFEVRSRGRVWAKMVRIYLLARLLRSCQRGVSRCANHYFRAFVKHHYSGNSFFRRPYASNICFIYLLCTELKALEQFTNNSVAAGSNSFKDSMNCQNIWKLFWFFLKNFLDFRLNTIEKQGIIKLSSSSS